ncbi:MAG: 1,4-dihydroxy-6-naphthoate synthase [Bacteroidota bacterium]|nr:1,4-dihydroxy-6-naphthoate synthase [Bacteroidota bacterium]
MKLNIGFSTCPNDTFMFDAMVNGRIDTEGLQFDPVLADIENLNQYALAAELDVLKISYAAYPGVSEHYQILNSGSALGYANGPLLVSKHKIYPDEVNDLRVAIPGENTTANLLLSIAYPEIKQKKVYLFSDIEEVVLSGEADAGLLIHENRFTYQDRGLKLIIDLGTWWEKETGLPIPLGGIMVKRTLPQTTKEIVNRVLFNSVSFAMEHPSAGMDYIKHHAQSMKDDVVQKHIKLYVNDYSLNLGNKGREAIDGFFERALEHQKIKHLTQPIFAI